MSVKSKVDISHLRRSKLGKRVAEMVHRLEAEQAKLRGYNYVAVRTRQAIIRNGTEEAVRRAVKGRPTPGFFHFVAAGRPQDTYEWIALEHPGLKDVHERARTRLLTYGVKRFPGRKEAVSGYASPRRGRIVVSAMAS